MRIGWDGDSYFGVWMGIVPEGQWIGARVMMCKSLAKYPAEANGIVAFILSRFDTTERTPGVCITEYQIPISAFFVTVTVMTDKYGSTCFEIRPGRNFESALDAAFHSYSHDPNAS